MATSLETYAPFDSGAGANVTETTWRKMMKHMLGSASGVIRGFTNEFAPSAAGTGMTVTVDTGECWIRGHYGESTSLKTLTIATAHATLARKDRIVLRCDFNNNRIEVDVLTGTAAASPAVPSLTQSSSIWETSIGVVDIPATDTVISSSQVTDDRMYTSVQARYGKTAAQSPANNTYEAIVWSTSPLSRSGDISLNAAGNQFTLLRSGLWVITAQCRFTANATGKRELIIADPANVAGATCSDVLGQGGIVGTASAEATMQATTIMRFPANQAINAFAYQNSGAGLALLVGTNNITSISLVWVGP